MADQSAPVPQPSAIAVTALDLQMERERALLRQRLARDDAARAASPMVEVMVMSAYTVCDDPEQPQGRVMEVGTVFKMTEFDLASHIGRVQRTGPHTVSQG